MITETTIQAFFYAIEQKAPTSILDIGMFLRKIGSISREFGDYAIDDGIRLCAVDFGEEPLFPIYQSLYDAILQWPALLSEKEGNESEHYELALLIGEEKRGTVLSDERLLKWLKGRVEYLFTAYQDESQMRLLRKYGMANGIRLDGEGFVILKYH